MKIHEYQAPRTVRASWHTDQPWRVCARTPEEAKAIAEKIGKMTVVKAQVHVGRARESWRCEAGEDPTGRFRQGKKTF